ncbi:MAG: alpha-glucoside transport system substrate-binding protein [Actinomycetota bacterium]|nr:alpha-glucoside transport system substrate-binding protein [Actinomycetota bacterium]
MSARPFRFATPLVLLAAAVLVLSGCSSQVAERANPTPPHVVTVEGPITDHDADLLSASWKAWEKANNITILYTGTPDFESSIAVEAQQNNAPDLAIFAQPGIVGDLAKRGYLQPLPSSVMSNVTKNFPAAWSGYTTTGGSDYAAPLLASVNGWVFYSPKQFAALGVSVPTTWKELLALTEEIKNTTGSAPWCEGFSDGAESGADGESWVDDLVLRSAGATVYDQWVNHEISFADPRIEAAFNDVATVLLDPTLVNAGVGGVASINTATTPRVASALESGQCALTHQPSSFVNQLTNAKGTQAKIAPDGDYWAFPLPPVTAGTTPVTGGGYFVSAFSASADTVKVQQYLSSSAWATSRVKLGGAISPDLALPASLGSTPLEQESTKLLQSKSTIFRFDAAALMPAVVGSGTYLSGMVDWVNGTPTKTVLKTITLSWH